MPFNLTDDERILYQMVVQPEDLDNGMDWAGGVIVTNHRLMYERRPFRFSISFLFRWGLLFSWLRNEEEMQSLAIGRITSVKVSSERSMDLFWAALPRLIFIIPGIRLLRLFFRIRITRAEFFAGSQGIVVFCYSDRERDELLDAVEGARRATSQAALPARPRVTILP